MAKIYVKLNEVKNPSGKLADDKYCDSLRPSAVEKCDMTVTVCWDQINR